MLKKEYINDFFSRINNYKNFIGINPFVSKAGRYKEWPLNYYIDLLNLLKKYENKCFIVTWGPGELEKAKKIVSSVYAPNVILAPETDMKELAVLISKLDLFITGDTGPMHLASVLNIPIIAIFGPSDVEINRPWGDKNIVLYKDVGCNPCRNKSCNHLKCLHNLTPLEVYEKVKKFFDNDS